jgi:uncharacterized membrane protein
MIYMKKTEKAVMLIILLSFLIGAYFYPSMPDKMASHWNMEGEVNGYISRFWGLFLLPLMSLALLLLFITIPKIDPLKKNISTFRKYFDMFVLMIMIFLFYTYSLTIIWNLGFRFDFSMVLIPALSGLFFYTGVLLENSKRNWFIGIRTPWTISSDRVWNRTHKVGGKLFKVAAVISLLGLFFERLSFFFLIIPVIVVAIYTIVYSYFEYQKKR